MDKKMIAAITAAVLISCAAIVFGLGKENVLVSISAIIAFLLAVVVIWQLTEQTRLYSKRLELLQQEQSARISALQNASESVTEFTALPGITSKITSGVIEGLTRESSWMSDALASANIHPYGDTEFRVRTTHHAEEKEHLAFFLSRALFLRTVEKALALPNDSHVYVVIDAGSTLTPLLKHLGALARDVRGYIGNNTIEDSWFKTQEFSVDQLISAVGKIRFVTNSLSGIHSFMNEARMDDELHYDAAMYCFLLSGYPQITYASLAGRHTNQNLRDLIVRHRLASSNANVFVMGVTTGNYISVDNMLSEANTYPIPLARGRGHLSFKMNLINMADEVIVTGPLAKIIPPHMSVDRLNDLLSYKRHRRNLYWDPKYCLFIDDVSETAFFDPPPHEYPSDSLEIKYVVKKIQTALSEKAIPSKHKYLEKFQKKPLREYKYTAVPRELFDGVNKVKKYIDKHRPDNPPTIKLVTTSRSDSSALHILSQNVMSAYNKRKQRTSAFNVSEQSDEAFSQQLADSIDQSDAVFLLFKPDYKGGEETRREFPRHWSRRDLIEEWLE